MEKSKLYTACAADDPDAFGVQAQGTAINCYTDPGVVGFVVEAAALGDTEAKAYSGAGTDGDAEAKAHRNAETEAHSSADAKAKAHAKAERRAVAVAVSDAGSHRCTCVYACPLSLRAEDYQTAQQ